MAVETSIGAFLRNRRGRLSPVEVGLPQGLTSRRVPGLRREEVAQLAGVSVDYYVRLEQGRSRHVSNEVLDAVAAALRLTDVEREHLVNLARPPAGTTAAADPPPVLLRLLDQMRDVPAVVLGRGLRLLAWNAAADAVFGLGQLAVHDYNSAKHVFLDAAARDLYLNWREVAADIVAQLRLESGRYPRDQALTSLVGELSVHSPEFRRMWADVEVRPKSSGQTVLLHPEVGRLDLHYQTLTVPVGSEMSLMAYAFDESSPTAERYEVLRSWLAGRPERTEAQSG
jgi:transcriptional regulator with XRE-family HTH domain